MALGAKKYAPQVSLGALFLACQLADLVWPNFVLLGLESFAIDPGNTAMTPLHFSYYPYSHSLVAMSLWAALFAALYALLRRGRVRPAVLLGAVVLSHWFLDVLTHRPDMPLAAGESARIGFGLWNFPVAAVSVEAAMFAVGALVYLRQTQAVDRQGQLGLWALLVLLAGVYAANVAAPPPPSAAAVTWSAQAMWLFVAWAFWVDRHRAPRSAA
ncbi:MAG: hypothetical protein OEW35_16535 [Gammaproteobacteria bacterium]|nr:hypothetical protein [Gammaproteobacteria bacterium]MDH5311205.1 hypothetical protein [Gammaproteobacteria bacterium]